jgi:RNA polymerase sigma factor (sigma-70 family)
MSQLRWDHNEWRKLLRWVKGATHNRQDAEDLFHAAFLRLSEYANAAEVKSPAAFLVQTARNLAADQARHCRVRNELDDSANTLTRISDDAPLQTEALVARERLKRVEAGLNLLAPRTREIFLMHRLDGLKYRDIAQRFGISVSAVEKHVAKASLFLTGWVEGW